MTSGMAEWSKVCQVLQSDLHGIEIGDDAVGRHARLDLFRLGVHHDMAPL